jgi:NADH dehydrogenase FAD-containing subunit
MRPTALFLTTCFALFSFALGEGVLAHSIAYGLLITLFINGAGRWCRPEATDLASKIVIIGNSIGGIHAALRLERILGDYTRVDVTFITKAPFFQFNPLLPEVIGGSIQPGGVVNANRRVCPHSKFVTGEIQSIDRVKKQVLLIDKKQENRVLDYDQLIIANNLQNDDCKIPGVAEHAITLMNIGDALHIRETIYDCIEKAEFLNSDEGRKKLLTFVVIGAGLRGAAIAAEIIRLINSLVPLFVHVRKEMCRVILIDKKNRVLSKFSNSLSQLALTTLKKVGVECYLGSESEVIGVTKQCVKLRSNEEIISETVISTLTKLPKIISSLSTADNTNGLKVNEHLQLINDPSIFVVGEMAEMNNIHATDPAREKRLGKRAAYNAWALSQGFSLKKWRERFTFVSLANLGKHASVGSIFGIRMHGFFVSFLARMQCLLVLPGLERNTRIFFDWLLDIPFKSDIVVLSQKRVKKLEKSYYLAGQDIVRQGEIGKAAYLIESGEVEVLKTTDNETKCVATLGKGSYFGEISLFYNVEATATVRCKTNVYVTELPKAEFDLLLSSFPLLKDAIKATIDKRMKPS